MPRLPRNFFQTNFFHVITQGINKLFIFDSHNDIKYYIRLLNNVSKEENVKIISYCIMNNHAHILVKCNEICELSKFMQRVNTSYGIYYNKKYNRVGFVFRNRFKSEGIYDEHHYYSCIDYIYNNPVKAGICKTPQEYLYSNYKKYPIPNNNYYTFIDEDNDLLYQNIIDSFLAQNNTTIESISENPILLKTLIDLLKKQKLSLRKISELLSIGREKTRKIYHHKAVNKDRPK